jgi:hypothetical protein
VKRIVWTVVLGVGGLVVAVAITLGALALAGDVGGVVQPGLPGADRPVTATSPGRDDGGGVGESPSARSSPSHDAGDDGGSASDDSSGPGSGSDDSSGPGSGSDDHSGDDD